MSEMTNLQRDICREALGLHKSRRSKGNYYEGTYENTALTDAVNNGWMVRRKRDPVYLGYGRNVWEYKVTVVGAINVLHPGETLDPFDFPGVEPRQRELQL